MWCLTVSSDQLSALRVTLGDVGLASEHGLPHAAHVGAAHILAAVHLAIRDHSLPRVGSSSLHLNILMMRRLLILVCLLA